MKKLLQLLIISSSLLLTFSCSGDDGDVADGSSALQETWILRSVSEYASSDCSSSPGTNYSTDSEGGIAITTAVECVDLTDWFVLTSSDPTDLVWQNTFCNGDQDLAVSMYLQLTSTDALSAEAGGNYLKTIYAEQPNGLKYGATSNGEGSHDYSAYGRFYTYGSKMATEILATVGADWDSDTDGSLNLLANRVSDAVAPASETEWQYSADESSLVMKHIAGNTCVAYNFNRATSYELYGCTDESAANYFGSYKNDYMIAATKENGTCSYTSDEAGIECRKISHTDDDSDGLYSDEEYHNLTGVVDCTGACQYEGQTAWQGDGVCDGGARGAEFSCSAFNWDGWDCACAYITNEDGTKTGCEATYLAGVGAALDGDTDNQLGEGNGFGGTFDVTNCQAVCNVEDCGYDLGSVADQTTWDCCSETCLASLTADSATCPTDAACNTGGCNFFRAAAGTVGACCDETGPDAVASTPDDIDCSALAGNGTCDEVCNTGACNNDGGDCGTCSDNGQVRCSDGSCAATAEDCQ